MPTSLSNSDRQSSGGWIVSQEVVERIIGNQPHASPREASSAGSMSHLSKAERIAHAKKLKRNKIRMRDQQARLGMQRSQNYRSEVAIRGTAPFRPDGTQIKRDGKVIRQEPKQSAVPRPRSAAPIKKDWNYYRRGTTGCGGKGNLWQDLHHTPDVRLEGIVSKNAIKGDLKATELVMKRLQAEDKQEADRRAAQVTQARITRKKLTKKTEAGRRSSMARLDLTGLLQAGSPLNRAHSNLDGAAFFNAAAGASPEVNGAEGDDEERYVQLSKPKKHVSKKAAFMKVGVADLYGLVTMDSVLEQRINKVAEEGVAKKVMATKPLSCMDTTNRSSTIKTRTAADPTSMDEMVGEGEASPLKEKEWAGKRYCLDEAYFAGESLAENPALWPRAALADEDNYSESQAENQRGDDPNGLDGGTSLNATDFEEPTTPPAPAPYNRYRPTTAPALSPLELGSPSPALPPALQALFPPEDQFVPPIQRAVKNKGGRGGGGGAPKGRKASPTRSYGGSTNLSSKASP